MVKKAKSKQAQPVPINYLKIEHAEAASEREKAQAEIKAGRESGSDISVAYGELLLDEANDKLRRIKAINKYLGSRENALLETKLRSTPLASLLSGRQPAIGGEEFMAAQDIELAFMSIAGAVSFKPLSLERVDKSNVSRPLPPLTAKAIERYQCWANHWSERAKRGDRTLEIVVAAIIDMRPFSVIEGDIGIRHGLAKTVTIRGLRDYAARAGWASHHERRWLADSETSFRVFDPNRIVHAELQRSIDRARQVPSPDLRESA